MFGSKYLDKEDKIELGARQEQINRQNLILEGLNFLKHNWFLNKVQKYGLDTTKQYSVDPMSGKITEVKPQKNEPPRT